MPAPLVTTTTTTNGHDQRNNPIMDPSSSQEGYSSAAQSNSDSDEQGDHDAAKEDEADQVIGVSIGPTQSRLKARLTPAEEKSRIMESHGAYFDTIPDAAEPGPDALFLPEITLEPESLPDPEPAAVQRPDPVRQNGAHADTAAAPKDGQRSSFTRSILKNGLPRPRAWSGDAMSNLNLKKFLPDLTSLTKRSTLPFRSNSSHNRVGSQTGKAPEPRRSLDPGGATADLQRQRSFSSPDPNPSARDEPVPKLEPLNGSLAARHSFTRRPSTVSGRPASLQRSSSDQSLYLRAPPTASSLDQRPQYEHIHAQVNSRFKAIKDSIQDSSSRLLSMPSLHLQDLRSEWTYKPFLAEVANRKEADEPRSHREVLKEKIPPPREQSPRINPASTHPILREAIDELTGDIVILGGYRGSILRSAKPPHRQLWVPMKVGLNIRKVDLEVGLHPEDEERMEETIIPSGVLSHVGPVDICRRLLKRLQKSDNAANGKLRVWNYGYDWRLSPHLLSRKLIQFLDGLPSNSPDVPRHQRGAYVIAHSLGGLITRHAVNQRPELFAGVLYAGVPQHCVNILGALRHGDEVLLSSRVLTAQVNFTFRTSFALLPEDGHCFIDKRTKEEYRVDFFAAQTWDDLCLSPCIRPTLPPLSPPLRGFKDNISKRFSTVLGKDFVGPDEPAADSLPRRNADIPAAPTDPISDVANKASAIAPTADGLVGPTANPRASAHPRLAATTCTIPRAAAFAYLERTLAEVKRFKQELAFRPALHKDNRYPPAAVLYGKSVPTLYGARVAGREQIKHQDAYDDLAFAAGDGVCLASAAMLPPGYRVIRDGLVQSERGHVGLLGDLEGVGQCLRALIRGRSEGVGCGPSV
ncbi:uncharacterized protein ACLA_006210 [Aspergillus clavatus NRRL 1]|uniref:Phosphatidylcholine-sterol O-acyltransferase-like protein n=1 Tax=Aspergillus clavatus (strain ATCC 1007 / CBS 513.65 / DSM 816 / NCTC 3887 / NRRL 1 / QM 1276 / 107) TaxID=344612 RepID=A1CDD7_ASPCL|nr:uncharacterized protein ACLA_006210 [Aspergillus clavatus NRRL 1]EAW11864.1 conserved hypothetical protein [Aspergillus clavatus NRRL 1]